MSRRYWFMWFLALALAAMLGDFQGYEADAGTMAGGTAIALGGLDSFAKTVDKYAKGNLGKMVGMVIAIAGIAGMAFQKIGMGLTALGAGIAIAFVPNIIGTAFDTTAASPLSAAVAFVPWAAGGGVLNTLAQIGFVTLWPVAAVVKVVRDPVTWLSLSLVALVRPSLMIGLMREQAQSLRRPFDYAQDQGRLLRHPERKSKDQDEILWRASWRLLPSGSASRVG